MSALLDLLVDLLATVVMWLILISAAVVLTASALALASLL